MNKFTRKEIETFCVRLKQLTWDNKHTQARLEIANYFGLDKHYRVFKAIEEIHDTVGYLPAEMNGYRYRKGIELLEAIKQEHGEEVYQQIYDSL